MEESLCCDKTHQKKWYFKTSVLVIALLSFLALALPLLWFNPRFKTRTKLLISLLVVVGTYYSWIWTKAMMEFLLTHTKLLLSGAGL